MIRKLSFAVLKMSSSSSSSSSRPVKEGWLHKEGGAARNKWQSRWFVLRSDTLYYYQKKEDTNPLGAINLSEADDISKIGEHSGRSHCMAIVGVKGGKKVYYLSSETSDVLNEWYVAFKAVSTSSDRKGTKYCTAELFLNTPGVRVNGDINYEILTSLSLRTPPEKKSRDHLGWFCQRSVALSTLLNLFSQYNWHPDKIYRSSGLIPSEQGVNPVIRVIFCKSNDKKVSHEIISERSELTGSIKRGRASVNTLGGTENVLEGTDDELIDLMQEFGIPLNLLQV